MILSILIASVNGREEMLRATLDGLKANQYSDVEVIVAKDNKEISIGKKRQALLQMAKGEWCVMRDDDDSDYGNYIDLILEGIAKNPKADCLGTWGKMLTDGRNPQTWCHSLRFNKWENKKAGFDFVRPPIHFSPVKTALALQSGYRDMRFGEDRDYSDRLYPLLKRETFIDEPFFLYQYSTKIPHSIKYGIK